MSVIHIPRKHLRRPTKGPLLVADDCDAAIATAFDGLIGERWISRGMPLFTPENGTEVRAPLLSFPPALTILSIWHARRGADYFNDDGTSALISTPQAASGYFAGRTGAIGGGNTGNLTSQRFTLFGVADYSQSTATIPGLVPTTVATIWRGNNTQVEFYDDGGMPGRMTLRDTFATGALGGGGPVSILNMIASVAVLLVWPRAMPTGELFEHAANPWKNFRADPIRIYSLPSGPISVSWSSLTASGITPTTATLTIGGITR